MKTAFISIVALIGIASVSGCTDAGSTKPNNGYYGTKSDRGLNIDSQSPSVPERSGAGIGQTQGNLPQGSNAPTPPTTQP